ncbi:acetyltransferase [Dyella sp. M7H15-1]|uniref:acetyltransferase n=1 Tax=Dyella sp. M7H15-1 TaxID=2501295 RepID=UPI001004F0E3|nr:acetyltransferase [Dyella sp. M7H15-1]QAU24994.1 acetyltransferase [Dyella sp. M7H15-1]
MVKGVVMIGAGGHAKVCIELLRAMGRSVDFCIGNAGAAQTCLGVPVVEGDEYMAKLRKQGYEEAFIAIGSNSLRNRLGIQAMNLGYKLVNAISPVAQISPSASIGNGVAIMAGVIINAETIIGDLAVINTGASIDHDCHIGRAVHIAPQCALAGNVTIASEAFLGVGCKVIPGIKIGENTTLGAGAVAIRNIPANMKAVGVPARIVN